MAPPEISQSDARDFNDLPRSLERVAARARGESPPRFYLDASRIRALARKEKLPVLVLCLSSSLSGLAACVMVFLALHANPQMVSTDRSANVNGSTEMTSLITTSGAAASRGESGQTGPGYSGAVISNVSPASETSDTDALFSPLYWELP